jgi:hypothetical protein
VIILIVHIIRITVFKRERNAPVWAHRDRPSAFPIAGQGMQMERCQIHVGDLLGSIPCSQDVSDLSAMLRRNPAFLTMAEEPFQTKVFEADDHCQQCSVTIVNCFRKTIGCHTG